MKKRISTLKLLTPILLVGLANCAALQGTRSPPPSYKHYVLKVKEQMLYGRDTSEDLPLADCNDTEASKANCYVFFRSEFSRLLKDLADRDIRLKACETEPSIF